MRLLLLGGLALLALVVYCLIDCAQTSSATVRTLPKSMWLLLIAAVPLVGAVAWLVSGRPEGAPAVPGGPPRPAAGRGATSGRAGGSPVRPGSPLGPDDDPEFLRQIRAIDAEHRRTLEQWERDLRDRERRLRRGDPPSDGKPPTDGSPPPDGPPPPPASSGGPR